MIKKTEKVICDRCSSDIAFGTKVPSRNYVVINAVGLDICDDCMDLGVPLSSWLEVSEDKNGGPIQSLLGTKVTHI